MFASQKPVKILSDPDKLLSYAAWYYGRYAPPLAKLQAKLRAKASTPELAESVFEAFSRYADDKTNLESKLASAAVRGKPLSKVRNSLILKWFRKDEVCSVSESESAFFDWNVREPAIRKRLESFLSKGKPFSSNVAALRAEYPEFRDSIAEFVRENSPDDRNVLRNFHGLPETVPKDPGTKKKLQDRLLRLGFRFSDIAAFFEEGGEYEEDGGE